MVFYNYASPNPFNKAIAQAKASPRGGIEPNPLSLTGSKRDTTKNTLLLRVIAIPALTFRIPSSFFACIRSLLYYLRLAVSLLISKL